MNQWPKTTSSHVSFGWDQIPAGYTSDWCKRRNPLLLVYVLDNKGDDSRGSKVLFLPGALVIYNGHFVHWACGLIKEMDGSGACVEPQSYIRSPSEDILLSINLARASVHLFVHGDMSNHCHGGGDHV